MKILGILVCLLALAAGAFQVWLFHVITFGEPNPAYLFEFEPPEGYSYWKRKAFWEDFWIFAAYSSITVMTALVPVVALVWHSSHKQPSLTGRVWIVTAAFLLGIPPATLTAMQAYAPSFHWAQLALPVLLAGCIFAILLTLGSPKEKRMPNNKTRLDNRH